MPKWRSSNSFFSTGRLSLADGARTKKPSISDIANPADARHLPRKPPHSQSVRFEVRESCRRPVILLFFLSLHLGRRCLTAGDTRFPLIILEIRAGGLAFEF